QQQNQHVHLPGGGRRRSCGDLEPLVKSRAHDAGMKFLGERLRLLEESDPHRRVHPGLQIAVRVEPVLPSPVSAVIATRLKPGTEAVYRAWEQKIAAAQSKAKGFQGYRFEPPIPGVQDTLWCRIR